MTLFIGSRGVAVYRHAGATRFRRVARCVFVNKNPSPKGDYILSGGLPSPVNPLAQCLRTFFDSRRISKPSSAYWEV